MGTNKVDVEVVLNVFGQNMSSPIDTAVTSI